MSVSAPPARLLLRPGAPVLRRDATTLQVGLHPPLAVRLPDLPEVRALLDGLREGAVPDGLTPAAEEALDRLLAAGLAFPGVPEPGDAQLAATRAQFGADAVRRLAHRRTHAIGLRADAWSQPVVRDLVATAGLVVDDAAPSVWLVVAAGPVARESIDPLLRTGTPHLVVSGDAGGRRVGPFVEPGRTACLRCVDAHEAEADPRRPFLVEQAAITGGATPPPLDPLLDRLALSWAVRDLCRYLEGDEPSTWSTTVDIGPGDVPRVQRRLRHPHCGCSWDLLSDLP
ncbi:hypothetical protein [Nocardioides antri]|uniref:TOMM leader peptide-binding protein n=1 Tax=Nocardioides antri TaxID=2607659 RepID=A0A5B1M581_9ACTN|nr:hypothetical protein [Nocardioides antri]KAA1426927.1 hypothetical protein F0U47_11455 [Nocardioides antri]